MNPSPVQDLPDRFAAALRDANPAAQALLLGALLRQAHTWQVSLSPTADPHLIGLQLHMSLPANTLASLIKGTPSPEALSTLIGLAAI